MDQVQVIRWKVLVEGRRIRAVAREMGVSRNTVRRYLSEPEPVRKARKAKARPIYAAIQPRVEELLEEWAGRTTPKQRITATRVHRELVEAGHAVGLTTVSEILREKRREAQEVFVPLVHRPGDEAQVDFFEVTVEVGGERRRAWKFVMRLMYSGRDFAWLYDRCDQVAFLDGHVRGFGHFAAVPRRCIYDNLSPAVRKVVFPHRELTARFRALVSHYLFEPCFTRPGEGHDKGGVEARGKAIRLQHLVPIPRGERLAEIAAVVLAEIERVGGQRRDRDGRTVSERFVEERREMQVLPERPFEARKVVLVEVSRRSLVQVEGSVYSVPSRWKGLSATAYIGPEDVRILCRDEVEVYERERFGGKRIRYRHYLPELSRRPQALRQVAPELLGELGEPYGELWRLLVDQHGPADAARVFARVLQAAVDRGEEAVGRAVARSLEAGRLGVLPLERTESRTTRIAVPESLAGYEIEATPAAAYDALLEASHE